MEGPWLFYSPKGKYCSCSTIRKDIITAMRKLKPTCVSVLPVSADVEIPSEEQIPHLDSSRSVKGSPARRPVCSSVLLDLPLWLALVLSLCRASMFKHLFTSIFTQIPFSVWFYLRRIAANQIHISALLIQLWNTFILIMRNQYLQTPLQTDIEASSFQFL